VRLISILLVARLCVAYRLASPCVFQHPFGVVAILRGVVCTFITTPCECGTWTC